MKIGKRKKIMIVEDELLTVELIRQILTDRGYNVVSAVSSGEEALRELSNNKSDLVLMDIMIKGRTDGISLTKIINERYDIPVIYLTAYADDNTIERARQTESYGYILKPFGESELISSIEIALYKHTLDRRLRESEERYRTLFATMKDAIYIHTIEGALTDFNPALLDMYGYAREEIMRVNVRDVFVDPDEPDKFLNVLKNYGFLKDFETRHYRKDGSIIYCTISANAIKSEDGKILLIRGIIRDVTDCKRSEMALRESEARYRLLAEKSSDVIWTMNLEGRFTYVSPSVTALSGFTPEEVLEIPIDRYILPEYVPSFMEEIARERRKPPGEHVEHDVIEIKQYTKDGSAIDVEVTTSWILDEKGEPIGLQGSTRDIRKRKRAERELRLTLEATTDGIWSWDLDKDEMFFSDRYYAMLGYEPGEFPASYQSWLELLHPDDRVRAVKAVEAYLKAGDDDNEFTFRARTKDGSYRWVHTKGRAVERGADGRIIRMVGSLVDITARKLSKNELRESEERYRLLAEHILDVVWLLDIKTDRFTYVSPSVYQLRGFSAEEVMTQPASDSLLPESQDKVAQWLADTLRAGRDSLGNGKRVSYFVEQPCKDGSTVWTEVVADFIYDEKGTPIEIIGVSRDVTDRRKDEEELRKYREHLEELVRERTDELKQYNEQLKSEVAERKTAEDAVSREKVFSDTVTNSLPGIFFVAEEKGNVVRWNNNFELVTSYSAQEISNLKLHDIIDPDYREVFLDSTSTVSAKGSFTIDTRIWSKYGFSFPYLLSGYGMSIDGKGYIVGVGIDILKLKITEDELKKLSSAVEQSPASVVITDINGNIEYVNPTFCRLTGYPAEEVIGENPRILKSGDMPKSYYRDLWDTILSGKIWQGETCNKKKNGEFIWESTHISPIFNDKGVITHFVAVKIDITEKKIAELELKLAKDAAEAAARAKGDFLANMSHEIRTPMNAIIGMNYLMQKTGLSPKQRGYIEKIMLSSQNLLGIINDILDFSKIEAGKMSLEMVAFSLGDVMANVSNMISEKAWEKGLALTVNVGSSIPERLIGDPLRVEQVMLNLANNAIKFTAKGGIKIDAEAVVSGKGRALLKISVRDTGIGISPEQRNLLFQPFSQADTSTTRKFGGTGLGLSISKHLVEMMGGEIGVESEPGTGSVFSFVVSLRVASDSPEDGYALPESLKGARALVVEDDASSMLLLESYLRGFGFDTTSVSSGEEALGKMKTEASEGRKYDLMLIDWYMPGIDGIDTVRKVKDCKEIPDKPKIILETGFEVDEATIKSLETLIDYFLFKPVSKSQLFDAVMTVFGLDKSKRNRIEPAGEELPEGIKRIRGARILLVEDNAINQEVACEIIQAEGFNVSLADDGLQALMKIRETAAGGGYDAVLMDLQMPEMDGYEATREIRKDHRFLNLPIIAMTAEALAGVSERVMAVGMNDYVTKPITPRLLFESLVRWIEPGDRAPFDSGNAVGEAKAMGAELPEAMNGINIASGLNRMRGNREKYHALLLKFSNNHGEILSEIRKALKKKNPDTAVRLAHNLRGVSGNIGADKLAAAARDLEAGIKKKQRKNLNLLLQSAERELGAVLASIRQVAGVGAEPSGAQRKGEADMEKAAATARSLKQLIETFDTRALDEFAVLKDILIGAPIAEELAVMERLLGRYEFNDAMSMLEDIMKKLQLDDTTASPGVSDNA